MDVGQYVAALREDLTAAAAAGDEQARRTAALLGAAVEPAARLAIMNALSDLAAEVTAALGDRVVEVRLDGRDVRVAVSDPVSEPDREPEEERGSTVPPFMRGGAGDDLSRITLRLMEQIKSQAEQAASQQGMSLNSWVSQAVQGALSGKPGRQQGRRDPRRPSDGRRLKGWVQG